MKRCSKCSKIKPSSEFHLRSERNNGDGLQSRCKECTREDGKHPDRVIQKYNEMLRRTYGISYTEYLEIISEQGGGCAICGREVCTDGKKLHVDHCHSSGTIRGILCNLCNSMIGNAVNDPAILRLGANYLEKAERQRTLKHYLEAL